MNTIPSVGPDAGISPRTGSASPQTPSQQRADTAPAVIADSAASADPGVLLKITPPVQSRQGDASVMGEAGGLPSTEALAQALARELTGPIESSGEQADLAIAKRISDAFAALPVEVQEAIKQASSPAIAQLLRLAAMTASGIREAPAHILNAPGPLGSDPGAAALQLHQVLRDAPPFQLARMMREALMSDPGAQGAEMRSLFQQLSALRAQAAKGSAALAYASTAAGQASAGQPHGATQSNALGPMLDMLLGEAGDAPSASFQTIGPLVSTRQGAQANLAGAGGAGPQSLADQRFAANPNAAAFDANGLLRHGPGEGSPDGAGLSQALANDVGEAQPSASPIATPSSTPNSTLMAMANSLQAGASAAGAMQQTDAMGASQAVQAALMLISPQQGEQALRDGLKILMDGRMVWHGQFTPGVPMAMERSDAWRADRDSVGGMQKGTALRFRLSLPQLGEIEIRAVGFGGQVSARVHAHPAVTSTLAQALPDLQARLRANGLAGAHVAVEPH